MKILTRQPAKIRGATLRQSIDEICKELRHFFIIMIWFGHSCMVASKGAPLLLYDFYDCGGALLTSTYLNRWKRSIKVYTGVASLFGETIPILRASRKGDLSAMLIQRHQPLPRYPRTLRDQNNCSVRNAEA